MGNTHDGGIHPDYADHYDGDNNDVEGRVIKGMKIGETLGKGTFGYVKLGVHQKTGKKVAMKFLKRETSKFKEEVVKKEIDCMLKVDHPNVVRLVAHKMSVDYPKQDGTTEKVVLMVLEFCNGGDLYDVIYYAGALEEKLGRTYFKQIVDGLQAIHKIGITHRDLKPNNILIDSNYQLKITDFGLSHIGSEKENPKDKRMETVWVGTRGYRAPELVLGRKYSNQADVFALGVCLFVMLCARQPFKSAAATDPWYKCIASKQYKKYWKSHKNSKLSIPAKSMLQALLCYQPRERITLDKALQHEWMVTADNKLDVYSQDELVSHMRKLHAASVEKKLKDKAREKRLQNSEAGKKTRAFEDNDESCHFYGVAPPEVDAISPVKACYEIIMDEKYPPHVVMEKGIDWVNQNHGKVEMSKEEFKVTCTVSGLDNQVGKYGTKFHAQMVKRKNVTKRYVELTEDELGAFQQGFGRENDEECKNCLDAKGNVIKSTVAKVPVGAQFGDFNREEFEQATVDMDFSIVQDEALVLTMWLDDEFKQLDKLDVVGAKGFDGFFLAVQQHCAGGFVEIFEVKVDPAAVNQLNLEDLKEEFDMDELHRAYRPEEEVAGKEEEEQPDLPAVDAEEDEEAEEEKDAAKPETS